MSSPALLSTPSPMLHGRGGSAPLLLRRAISVEVRAVATTKGKPAAPGGCGGSSDAPASTPAAPAPAGIPAPRGLLRALSASADLEPELSLRFYRSGLGRLIPCSSAPDALVAAALSAAGPASAAGLLVEDKGGAAATPPVPADGPPATTTIRAALIANPAVRYGVAPAGAGPATRIYLTAQGGGRSAAAGAVPVSPWHDVPLQAVASASTPTAAAAAAAAAPFFNMVVECPAGSTAKLEVDAAASPLNPLVQDTTKAGAPRFFPAPLFFSYGMLPQTYEDPNVKDAESGAPGDGDPVDVVEVGGWVSVGGGGDGHQATTTGGAACGPRPGGAPAAHPATAPLPAGSVVPVKVLGALALIDSGELDWKVLAIRASHPAAPALHTVADLEAAAGPGCLDRLVDWFTNYKVCEGKPPNTWARGGVPVSPADAVAVINHTATTYAAAGLAPPSTLAPPSLTLVRTRSRVALPHVAEAA